MDKKYYIIGGGVILLLILGGVVFFTGGAKAPPPPKAVTLTWWKTFEDTENIQPLIDDYTKIHKNVTINFVKKDASDYEQELLNAFAAGQGPDIFSIHNDWLAKHIDKMAPAPDTLLTLRSYKDNFVDVATSDFVKDQKIYAIPLSTDVLALYYNKDLMNSAGISQPPSTWPELISDVQKIKKSPKPGVFSVSGIALGTSTNVNRAVDIVTLMMLQNGAKFYTEDLRSSTFDQVQSIAATGESFNPGGLGLTLYTQFANPATLSYNWNTKSDYSVDAFTQGKVAMMINYSYMEPAIKVRAPNLNWEVAPIPQISEDVNKVDFANYWGESVSKASDNQLEAWKFLDFISSKPELTAYYAKHLLVSSRKDILPDQISDTKIGPFAEGALTARSVYKQDPNVYEGVFIQMIDDVILNSKQIDDAMHNAVSQINLNLSQQQQKQ